MRKGVSNRVLELSLLVVAVLAFVLIRYALTALPAMWAKEYVEKSLENIEHAREENCTSARFLIYSCAYIESGKTLNMVLENTGDVELKSLRAFLVFQNGSISNPISLEGTLDAGMLRSFSIEGVERISRLSVLTHCPDVVGEKVCSIAA